MTDTFLWKFLLHPVVQIGVLAVLVLVVYYIVTTLRYRARREMRELGVEPNLCPKCHKPIGEEFRVCPQCGEALRKDCPYCARQVQVTWAICPYCEKDLASPCAKDDK